jgi:hypothetical protein
MQSVSVEDRMPHNQMAERSLGQTGALLMKRKMLALDAFQNHSIQKVENFASIYKHRSSD